MTLAGRPIFAVATAAFMLLGHVLCACGGSSHAPARAAASRSCCHDRREAATRNAPSPQKDHDNHPCPHCKRIAAAPQLKAKDTAVLSPLAPGIALTSAHQPLSIALRPQPSRFDRIPSPQALPTLLNLHCALIS